MKKSNVVAAVLTAGLIVSGCAPRISGDEYSVRGVGEVSQTEIGTIVSARPVVVSSSDPSKLGTGSVIGGATGAVLGSQVGQGHTPYIAGAVGALGGAAIGHLAEHKLQETDAVEYTVRLDNGKNVTIAQGTEPKMSAGQRVKVIYSNRDRSRVVPL